MVPPAWPVSSRRLSGAARADCDQPVASPGLIGLGKPIADRLDHLQPTESPSVVSARGRVIGPSQAPGDGCAVFRLAVEVRLALINARPICV